MFSPMLLPYLYQRKRTKHNLMLACLILLVGCAGIDAKYAAYYEKNPHTIIVLPAENETTDVEAGRFFLSTITRPLINRGYYVFPVEAVEEILAREGIYQAGEANQIPPQNFYKYFGADAVLYTTVESWDTAYLVVASDVNVAIRYRLADTRSGETLWSYYAVESVHSGAAGNDALTLLISAAIDAALTAALTDYIDLAARANYHALSTLPPGSYHPDYPEIQRRLQAWKSEQKKKN